MRADITDPIDEPSNPSSKAMTGIAGLDDVLCGGLPRGRVYLVQGDPGVGKTTLAVQFLREGARLGERCLYVTLSESREELSAVAVSHDWTLDGIEVFDMAAAHGGPHAEEENTLYVPAEVELGERMRDLLREVDRVKPQRVVIDSCSELRLLASSSVRFRRQLLALKLEIAPRGCTVLLLDNPTTPGGDVLVQSMVHGVVSMEQLTADYGSARRRLRIVKLREVAYRGGFHDFIIERTGLAVFPRLVAAEHPGTFPGEMIASGLPAVDALLGGGVDRGTSVLVVGPAGTGKSALSTQYAVAAAGRGEHVAMFVFDEGHGTLLARAAATGMDLKRHVDEGHISIQHIDPAEMSPGQLVHVIRSAVEQRDARMVVIDSLNGYLHSMPEEKFLALHLHELLSYLRQRGVVTVMVIAQHGFVGHMESVVDVSYVADTVVLTRYFEADGRVRKALSVLKKRSGAHEDTIREFTLGPKGFEIGPPLEGFRGVMTGVPVLDEKAFGRHT